MPHMESQTFNFETLRVIYSKIKGWSLIFLGNTFPLWDLTPELTRTCVAQLISQPNPYLKTDVMTQQWVLCH